MKKLFILLLISVGITKPAFADRAANEAIAAGIMMAMVAAANSCDEDDFKNYTSGREMFAFPGNAVIDIKNNACKKDELVLTKNLKPVKNYSYLINLGKTIPRPENKREIEIAKDNFGDNLYITVDKDGLVLKAPASLKHLQDKKIFTPRDTILVRENTFSQEIIYTGIEGDTIHFTYREFIGQLIQSAFSIPMVFDLKKSRVINIKGYEFKVLNANNTEIRYVVND